MDSFRQRHPPSSLCLRQRFLTSVVAALAALAAVSASLADTASSEGEISSPEPDWAKTLTPSAIHPFPQPAPFRASYRFGWEGIPAGGARVEVGPSSVPGSLRIMAAGGPNDLIRRLWNYHAHYVGEAGPLGGVPSWFRMDEEVAKGDLLSEATFSPGLALSCHRMVAEEKPWKVTRLPGIRDLFAAMLFVRSQPLRDGDHLRLVVFPDQHPYLVDLSVVGREMLVIAEKKTPAIRFSIGIQSIATGESDYGKLSPHKKFRSGRIWMSDDDRRLPIKAEVDVFIGAVYAELAQISPPF